MTRAVPELLSPAGTLRNMRYALAYGADAVYAGQPRYSLRARNNDFTLENLRLGIDEAHAQGKKFFVASNVLPHNRKVDTYLADMEPVIDMGPDALIMADPGLISMVRERWPEVPVHLSVQANTVNYAAVRFWQSLGLTRVILSRELSLEEIEDIRQRCPEMELEVFVHGALCIAYSGRCLLSGYFNHRDSNQGTCTNSCRWQYDITPAAENETGDLVQADPTVGGMQRHGQSGGSYLLEERERPGEFMPIEEDEHGTYILNSKDLRAIEHVTQLVRIGVDSFKIEGRTKSHYYVARTAQAYRRAIDDAVAGRPFDERLLGELSALANRGYTDGFYQRHHTEEYQNYMEAASREVQQRFVAEVTGYDTATGLTEVLAKNKFAVGDLLELLTPDGNVRFILQYMLDQNDQPINEAPGSDHRVKITLPIDEVPETALLARNL